MSSSAVYTANRCQQTWSNSHQLRKQKSLSENTVDTSRISNPSVDSNRSRGRGKSGSGSGRSGSVILGRLPSERNKFLYLQKQRSVVDQVCAGIRGRSEQRTRKYSIGSGGDKGSWTNQVGGKNVTSGGPPKLAWTDNTFDCDRLIESGTFLGSNSKKNASSQHLLSDRSKKLLNGSSTKLDNKINLNINLTQTIKSIDNESIGSDIDSSSEGAEHMKITPQHTDTKKSILDISKNNVQSENRIPSAAQRRAQFHMSKGEQFSTHNTLQTVNSPNSVTLSVSPSLTIQKRPPLVRAMSAPVRSIADTTKNLFGNTKRKTRRRRILPRNSSHDKGEEEAILESSTYAQTGKKKISRSRSTIGSDVITLVSLASSEGSDSEKEESGSTDECQTTRAPSLRKTGKSVSFQENEQPTFQMAVKEFPHMLRRGSIAPLAARLRSNRPPTAPPGSIFRSDFENCTIKMSQLTKNQTKDDSLEGSDRKESINLSNNDNSSSPELPVDCFDFPDHVRSLKERECWRLFQKMSKKGVSVKYDTILRGMLTPTEFRQLQKQRDLEDEKNQNENEEKSELAANDAETKGCNKNNTN